MAKSGSSGDFQQFVRDTSKRLDSVERHKHAGMLPVTQGASNVPNPPTWVRWDREIVGGEPATHTQWEPPTTNTDGSELTDLFRYEVQQQIGLTVSWGEPSEVAPSKPDEALNRLMDRKGMGLGFTGGDGGASHRDDQGNDWWFWSDSNWGELRADGSTKTWYMLRNSLTKTRGTNRSSTVMKVGHENQFPAEMPPSMWVSPASRGTLVEVPGGVEFTPAVDGGYFYTQNDVSIPVVPGEEVTLSVRVESEALTRISLQFVSLDGGVIETVHSGQASLDDSIVSVSGVAPEGAQIARLIVRAALTDPKPVTVTQVYGAKGDVPMASWRLPVAGYDFTNLMHDPEGRGGEVDLSSTEVWRNIAGNPSFEGDVNPANIYSGCTYEFVTDSTAWVGHRIYRVSRNNAGNGNLAMFDYGGRAGDVAAGDQVRYRLRIRRDRMVNPNSTMYGRFLYYNNGSRVTPDGPTQTITLTDEWVEYTFTGVVPEGANTAALMLTASGPAWSASDRFDVDGREMYVGSTLPASYFDGSTPSGDGFEYEWSGVPHESDSIMRSTSVQRRNAALFPEDPSVDRWGAVAGAEVTVDSSDHPDGGTGVTLPEVVNPDALTSFKSRLRTSKNVITGIGVVSDSTAETTGSMENPNLADRYIETLQRELRRRVQSPGVEVDPVGYYGATSYVAARFQHPGPIDWVTRGPVVEYVDMGSGGRGFGLPYGSSAHLRATFDRAVVEIPTHGWGRMAVISVDGVEVERVSTYSAEYGLMQWDTGSLGHGEHLISVESSRDPALGNGEVRVSGAMLFDEASDTRGVRVYDMSCSGRALEDYTIYPNILPSNVQRPLDLMIWSLDFNDAGRNITPAQHKARYKTLIARQRSLGFTGPTLLMSKWDPGDGVVAGWTYSMDQYRQAMREVAEEDADVAFIDLGEVIPGPEVDSSLFSDWIHPSEIGHQRIAGVLLELLWGETGNRSVVVRSDASGEGVEYATFGADSFYKDTTWTMSVDVKGPEGRVVRPGVASSGPGQTITGGTFTLSGDWQRVSVTGLITSVSPRLQILQADSGGPMTFRVLRPMAEEGVSTGDYFSHETPDTAEVDYRQQPDGSSIAVAYTPVLWKPVGQSLVRFTDDVKHSFTGSTRVEAIAEGGAAGVDVLADSAGGPSLASATLAGWVLPGPGMTQIVASTLVDGSPSSSRLLSVQPGIWFEFRLPVAPDGGAVTGVRLLGTSSTARSVLHATEVTLVEGDYTAPAFSGNSRGMHAESVWDGTPWASTSTLTMKNTSFTSDPLQNTTLISAEVFGLEGWKFLWCQGAIGDGNTGLMFLQTFFHRPMSEESGWNFHRYGDIVVARFDLESETLVDAYVLEEGADAQWGEGLWVEDGWLYVYGGTLPGDGTGSVVVRRYPADRIHDRLTGHGQTWTGTEWGGEFSDPGPVATLPIEGGFSAVRLLAGRWVALFTGGFMDHLQSWEAASPQGPFVPADVVMPYPDDGVNRYVPRFHPQFDSGELGVSMSICEAGGIKYQPFFLRGPSGERSAAFNDAFWGHLRYVEDPEHIETPVGLDEPYAVRVRAVDRFGNTSEWAVGEEVGDGPDMPEVPKPSTPTATSFFRGGRVYWDGTSEWGEPYEGFRHYEVHLSSAEEFDPNNWTRVDTSIVPGGITPISVETYSTYFVVVVVVTDAGRSEPSDPASFNPERLSDPDLGDTLIDGARLRPGSVNASALTVGTFTDNLLPNSTFEQPSLADETKPSMWTAGWPRGEVEGIDWEDAGHWERSEDEPVSGSASLRLETFETTWRQVLSDPPIPVQPGDIYYVAARIRTDGIDGDVEVKLLVGETEDDINGFGTASSDGLLVGRTAGGQSVNLVEGPVEIPDKRGDGTGVAMRFAALAIEAKATGREYTTWVDDVEVRRITGEAAIADASINRAKIRYLAVDDARIANVGVGKLVAGELFADITVSARIMTAKSGRRSEMNKDGYFTFNPYLTSGDDMVPITEVRTEDGGIISRWFRTNTTGTRIEMGTYGAGAGSALMSFYPEGSGDDAWFFPPAMGFGGSTRHGDLAPGIGIHAGSERGPSNNESLYYERYGMSMIGVSQRGGIHLVTGNLLNGTSSTDGAPITMNAGGEDSYIDLKSGSRENWSDPARLRLDPTRGQSLLALNHGRIQFVETGGGASEHYKIEFVSGETWLGENHLHIRTGYGSLRVSNGVYSNALLLQGGTLSIPGDMSANGSLKRGENSAGRVTTRQGTTLEWDRYGNPWTSQGTARATTAFWVNESGNIEGQGAWNVPRIKCRASESYVSFDASGGIYVDGSSVKSFVIPHPVDEERYLVHAAHEGDEMRVVYEGTSETEPGEGSRLVRLPDYFDALTVDGTEVVLLSEMVCDHGPRCDCSVKHTPVRGNSFEVHANTTSHAVPFSWRVTAVRAGTEFATEPRRSDTVVRGDGPYTYIESR